MSPQELKQMLIGCKIVDVAFPQDVIPDGFGIPLSQIFLDNGLVVELTGAADTAYVAELSMPDAAYVNVNDVDVRSLETSMLEKSANDK